ncbi:MAG: PEP-utilizing enzyme [Patescibacteria group bacterium]|nr:PEP-utilizing enzyme [Patescibacteria group bacterium]
MDNFRADYYLELFVLEFARRTKKEISDLKLLLPDELSGSLDFINEETILARKKCLVFAIKANNIENITGSNGLVVADPLFGVKDIEKNTIHGILASVGENNYFRGTAKVVLTVGEVKKIEEGDILVTTMTSPDFVQGMKKAGGIITDSGGMLCHAAIISREFKKPVLWVHKLQPR